ncbi:hypothetical protein NMY22_g4215 [Coprinellus aureogranulatus]|nr:hypothetical protein NMY22_g4215 [Coprinellus aureogranulatus]
MAKPKSRAKPSGARSNKQQRAPRKPPHKSVAPQTRMGRRPRQPSPPMEWPQYPKYGGTIEEIRLVERRQLEYRAFHGHYPWENLSPEDESSEDEDLEPDSNGNREREEDTGDLGHKFCPHSLEDDDLLHAIRFALETAAVYQPGPSSSASPVLQLPSSYGIPQYHATREQPIEPTTSSQSTLQNLDDQAHQSTVLVPNAIANEDNGTLSRLRPKNKLRKTERAQKIYRN